jgi:DNA-binding NarL/FixJ family response regulator
MNPPVASLAAVPLELRALERLASPNGAAEASGLFEQAAEAWTRHRRSAELRCRWAAGEAARLSGSMTRAQALLRPLEAAAEGRATSMLARVRTSLRKSGVAAAAGAAALPRGRLPSRLTSREREILRFVGSGLSSRDIAHMLSISQSTVETQIQTAMRKLGATTRVQAATLVWFRTEDALLGPSGSRAADHAD